MKTARLWGDVLVTLTTLFLLGGCGSSPETEGSAGPLCPARTTTATVPGAPAALTPVASFGTNPAGLKMYVHAPPGGKASAVVVALHGCTQNANGYAGAGWNEAADAAGFAVVYAEQTSANNGQQCFRWWDAANITRGKGEAASIAAMVEHAKKEYGATRAFVTGLSAGAAMTAVMLATYPDLFEAGAIMAGLPYECATSQNDAYSCMSPGKDKPPSAWGALVPKLSGAGAPRVSIWHGDADYTVRPANLEQLVRQWTSVNAVSDKPTATTTVGKAQHDEYRDASGVVRVDSWLVAGMSHGVSVDPASGCGKAGAFILDKGLCSTHQAAMFFGLVGPDPSSPGAGSSGASGTSPPGGSSGASTSGSGADCPP